jgi:hypothetical protein
MPKGRIVLLVLVVVGLLAPASRREAPAAQPTRAAISRSGELGGADYLIEVPANWGGGLVVFAHGIQRGPGRGDVRIPPIASHITGEGHAWIASGYRAREYQPHLFIEDLVALRALFVEQIGQPRWSVIYGQSMGGHIVVSSLELRPGLYQGGLAECGLVDGTGVADYLIAYTAAAELLAGVPLLDAPDRLAFGPLLEGIVRALGMPGSYTARDDTNPGLRAATNAHIRYRIDPGLGITEDELNARVRRVQALKDARSLTAAARWRQVARTGSCSEWCARRAIAAWTV